MITNLVNLVAQEFDPNLVNNSSQPVLTGHGFSVVA